jgi:transcriptional regulator with XRE-family HTH domain
MTASNIADRASDDRASEDSAVGARIRDARRARGLTQLELATAVGVSRSAVAQWETARAGQVRGNLSRIAACLGVGVGHLMQGDGPMGRDLHAGAGDSTELALLRLYRECDEEDRAFLLRTAIRLARNRK